MLGLRVYFLVGSVPALWCGHPARTHRRVAAPSPPRARHHDPVLPDLIAGFAAGAVIAVVTAPVGVSGAVFLLPFQITVLGVPSPAVTPTNLLFNVVSIPGALARYRRRGSLRSRLTGLLLVGTLPGVVIGALLRVHVIPEDAIFQVLVGCLLAPLGMWLLLRSLHPGQPRTTGQRLRDRWLVALGLGAGIVGGIYGIGGGSLIAPILVGAGFLVAEVAPAALVSTFVTSIVGAASFVAIAASGTPSAGPVWSIGIACGLGGLVGGYAGAHVQEHVPQRALTALLGGVALAVATAYIGRALVG